MNKYPGGQGRGQGRGQSRGQGRGGYQPRGGGRGLGRGAHTDGADRRQDNRSQQPPQQPPQQQGAWGRPPAQRLGGGRETVEETNLLQAGTPVYTGRGGIHRDVAPAQGVIAQTETISSESRGAVRGKRILTEILFTRPDKNMKKCGESGRNVKVTSNYFRVLKTPQWRIFQYRVDFAPDVDFLPVRRGLLAEHKALFGGYVFDGTVVFSTEHLEPKMTNGILELFSKLRNGDSVQIKIKFVNVVDVNDVQQLQVNNLILKRAMEGLKLQPVGRNVFDPLAKISLSQHRLEIWPGYTTSIRQHEQDVLLCVEITHKVMRTDSVHSILTQCIRDNRDYQSVFKALVCGTVVLTDYNNKTYRVDDVDFKSNPETKFPTKDGKEISFMEYYQRRYGLKIQDRGQPLLISRPTERNIRGGSTDMVRLIPEITRATGLTDAMRSNFTLMKAMSEHTRLPPGRRIERLKTFNNRLQSSQESQQVLTAWNLRLDQNMVELNARILDPETIVMGGNKEFKNDDKADWTNCFRNTAMYHQKDIVNWSVIAPARFMNDVMEFVRCCTTVANGMRMQIKEPQYQKMPDDRISSYHQAIENAGAKDQQILMVVLASNNAEKYSCVKKRCCVDRPVPSQVVTMKTVAPRNRGGLMSIATKVVIQMNAKLMGAPWTIKMPLPNCMVVGFDVCHSNKDKSRSFGALVATMDIKKSQKYYSAVMQHDSGQELSNEITMHMTYALKTFRNTHGRLPERILFYRDGVGDGQLAQVHSTEVTNLRKKLDEIYKTAGEEGCKMAFVVVTKRLNTRFFVRNENPPSGLVVDDIVTLPERYDFYLVSQSVRIGSVSPTSYNVISDNMGLTADRMQIITYKMTHLYYNSTATFRVPAVCQYAHKLAFLVAESLHRAPSNVLENQLYFL